MYADNQYTDKQMEQIRLGIVNGLTWEQIQFCTNSDFDKGQAQIIREGFMVGLSTEQVQIKDMSFMFSNCELPDKFALGNNFDTSKVEDMSGMFSACSIAKEFSLGDKFVINDNCYTDYMFETSNRDLIDFSSELNLNNFSQLEEADLDLDEEEI